MALTARQAVRKAWLEKAITEIQSAQLKGISAGLTMSFNGRSIQRHTPAELEKLMRTYESELCKLEKIELGTRTRTIRVVG